MKYILFMLSTYAVFVAFVYATCVDNAFGALLAFSLMTLNLSQLERGKRTTKKKDKKDEQDDMWYPGDDYGM